MRILLGNNPYCIVEMNNNQRQITPVLYDSVFPEWNVSFEFFICDLNKNIIKCSIYDRKQFSIDRLLGYIELPVSSLIDRQQQQ
ncbi:unnamed protein product, partial [Didymodactylos carnosus]